MLFGIVVEMQSQPHLLEVVLTRRAIGRFAHLLDRGHEQADEQADNGNYYQ
jgi:hypothetical protein